MGSVTKRFKNNMRARRMAMKAGLIERVGTEDEDGNIVDVVEFGAHRTEYRTPMLRLFRRHRRHQKERKKIRAERMKLRDRKRAERKRKEAEQPWWRRVAGKLNPFKNRGRG